MKIKLFILAIVIGVIFYNTNQPKLSRKELSLNIIFSCDTRGRLEPCGCFTGQYGGLSRLYTMRKRSLGSNNICVDVGDAIAGSEDYNFIQYNYILKAYKLMEYDALNIGKREAQLSLEQLQKVKKTTTIPIVSANLMDKNNKFIFSLYCIIKRQQYKIAIVGVLDPQAIGESLGKDLQIRQMELSISELLPQIKDADIRILLAFTDEPKLRQLAKEFYEFDIILGGNVTQPSQEIIRENRSMILYTTNQARTMGIINGKINDQSSFALTSYDIHLLRDNIPEEKKIIELSQQYRQTIRKTKLQIDHREKNMQNTVQGVLPAMTYVGSQVCTSCHNKTHQSWTDTSHAHAFSSLKRRDSDADPQCLRCHTVGFGEFSGYQRQYKGTKLINVGCESCHGPGSEHIEQQKSGKVLFHYRPLGEGDCRKCHYGEFSRPFVWKAFWPLVRHGKE